MTYTPGERQCVTLKTLEEIGAKVGDVIRWHSDHFGVKEYTIARVETASSGAVSYTLFDGPRISGGGQRFQMVSRAAGQPSTPAPSTAQPALARTAAYWSAHLDRPVSADDVRTMLRLHELANGAPVVGA
jgi:hypothetical protein